MITHLHPRDVRYDTEARTNAERVRWSYWEFLEACSALCKTAGLTNEWYQTDKESHESVFRVTHNVANNLNVNIELPLDDPKPTSEPEDPFGFLMNGLASMLGLAPEDLAKIDED